MKLLTKVLAITFVALMCAGYAYKDYQNKQAFQATLTTEKFVERIHSGDTVDGILKANYYNEVNEGVSYNEFKYNTLHLPQNKHLLNKDGYLKPLQVGDKLYIVCKVRKVKE